MFFNRWSQLSVRQRNNWKVGGLVIGIGGFIKFGYFYLSRGMIIDSLTEGDRSARMYLKESKEFAIKASEERRKRSPKLTEEQREQLQNYLILMAQQPENKEVYPHELRNMINKSKRSGM